MADSDLLTSQNALLLATLCGGAFPFLRYLAELIHFSKRAVVAFNVVLVFPAAVLALLAAIFGTFNATAANVIFAVACGLIVVNLVMQALIAIILWILGKPGAG
jgi:hypothetical protein